MLCGASVIPAAPGMQIRTSRRSSRRAYDDEWLKWTAPAAVVMSIASPAHAAQYMSVNEAQKHAFPNATGFAEVQAGRVWKAQSEAVRPWISYVHIAFGLAVPAVIVAHITVGRASTATKKAQMPRATAAAPVPTAATLVPADEPAEAILGNVS